MEKMTPQDYIEVEAAMESVLYTAMENVRYNVLDAKTRDSLPDDAFAIVFTDGDGKRQRKYPMRVKNDPEATEKLITKAVTYFHFCRPDWKPELAKAILKALKSEKVKITISRRSQLFKYINEKDLPITVTVTSQIPEKK